MFAGGEDLLQILKDQRNLFKKKLFLSHSILFNFLYDVTQVASGKIILEIYDLSVH